MLTLASIGFGNMAQAIYSGLLNKKAYKLACTIHKKPIPKKFNKVEAYQLDNLPKMLAGANYIFLSVKPKIAPQILEQIAPYLTKKHCLISIVAGLKLEDLKKIINNACPVALAMPSILVQVKAGLTALCLDDTLLADKQKSDITNIFNNLGSSYILSQDKIPAFTALAACSPAYILQLIDSFVKAGIELGFNADDAKQIALNTFIGTSLMAKKSDKHLIKLIEEICSPAGMTIKGVNFMHQKAIPGLFTKTILKVNED